MKGLEQQRALAYRFVVQHEWNALAEWACQNGYANAVNRFLPPVDATGKMILKSIISLQREVLGHNGMPTS